MQSILRETRQVLKLVLIAVCLSGLSGCGSSKSADIDFVSALHDLTNIALFAQTPTGKAGMISSYDRTGGNQDWNDLSGVGPDGLLSIADLKGPGIVRRFWETSIPADWELLFFFDGEKGPRIRTTFRDFFVTGGSPFLRPLCGQVSGAAYSYLPLPFRKSLRIALVVPKGQTARAYYQINYEIFDSNTIVESFPRKLEAIHTNAIQEVCSAWRDKASSVAESVKACDKDVQIEIKPGETGTFLSCSGAGCLDCFAVDVQWDRSLSALERLSLLRALVLKIYWNDRSEPSVQVPLGDFFCQALNTRRFESLPIAQVQNLMISRFPMPFEKGARIEITNDSSKPVQVGISYHIAARPPGTGNGNYFHAAWKQSISPGRPHLILAAMGRGHYVGCFLTVIGTDGTWTILEGDETIRIDGEAVPSLHGTGLEDYFNGGYYYFGLMDLPLHGLLEKASIRTCQYRFHLPDRIPFNSSLWVDMEFGDANVSRNTSRGYMSSVAYWYQSAPQSTGGPLPPLSARLPPPDPLERTAIMSRLIEFDKIGHFEEARERCLEYAEKYAGSPEAQVVALRGEAYQEAIEGYASVSNSYRETRERFPGSEAARQAALIEWFHTASSNALLGLPIKGKYRFFVDRQLVSERDDPASLAVVPLALAAGEHEFAVEILPTQRWPFFLAYLRTHRTGLPPFTAESDSGWSYTMQRPVGWPDTGDETVKWVPATGCWSRLPTMQAWQFAPNAFILMQAGNMLDVIKTDRMDPTFLRKKMTIP